MSNADPFDRALDNPTLGFESIFDETDDDPRNTLHEQTFSKVAPGPSSDETEKNGEMEETTIYISESERPPSEIGELNERLQEGWRVQDIRLGRRTSTQEYCFVVTLEREAPKSFFEAVTSYPDPASQ